MSTSFNGWNHLKASNDVLRKWMKTLVNIVLAILTVILMDWGILTRYIFNAGTQVNATATNDNSSLIVSLFVDD